MPASQVMKKFAAGKLHSGSKQGPKVTNPHQAKAIMLSEARDEGYKIPKKGGGKKMAGSKRDHDGAGMGHHNSNMPDGHKAVHGMHDGVKEHIHHAGNLNFHERHSTHEHTHSEHHHKMKHG